MTMPADQAAKPQIKFCKDCRNFDSPACSIAVSRFSYRDMVTGETDCDDGYWKAAHMRRNEGLCGERAEWFEQKPPNILRRIIARLAP